MALSRAAGVHVDTGDICRDLASCLRGGRRTSSMQSATRLMPSMIAYSAVNPEFGREWRFRVMEPPRHCIKQILARGIKRGLLSCRTWISKQEFRCCWGRCSTRISFKRNGSARAPDIGPKAAEAFWRAHYLGTPTGSAQASQASSESRRTLTRHCEFSLQRNTRLRHCALVK